MVSAFVADCKKAKAKQKGKKEYLLFGLVCLIAIFRIEKFASLVYISELLNTGCYYGDVEDS